MLKIEARRGQVLLNCTGTLKEQLSELMTVLHAWSWNIAEETGDPEIRECLRILIVKGLANQKVWEKAPESVQPYVEVDDPSELFEGGET